MPFKPERPSIFHPPRLALQLRLIIRGVTLFPRALRGTSRALSTPLRLCRKDAWTRHTPEKNGWRGWCCKCSMIFLLLTLFSPFKIELLSPLFVKIPTKKSTDKLGWRPFKELLEDSLAWSLWLSLVGFLDQHLCLCSCYCWSPHLQPMGPGGQ